MIVRTIDDADLERLRAAGATEVVPEAIEGSLMLASHALALVGVPMRRVLRVVQEQRDARYGLLRGYFHGADDDTVDELEHARLLSVTLPAAQRQRRPHARRAGAARTRRHRRVAAARLGRGARSPSDALALAAGDTLVLSGLPERAGAGRGSAADAGLSRRGRRPAAEPQVIGACLRQGGAHPRRHHGAGGAQQLERERGRALRQLFHARAAQGPDDARRHRLDVGHARRVAEQARLADDGAGAQDRDLAAARAGRRS